MVGEAGNTASYENETLPKLICQLDCTLPETEQIHSTAQFRCILEGGCTASLQFATGSDSKTPGLYAGQNQWFCDRLPGSPTCQGASCSYH